MAKLTAEEARILLAHLDEEESAKSKSPSQINKEIQQQMMRGLTPQPGTMLNAFQEGAKTGAQRTFGGMQQIFGMGGGDLPQRMNEQEQKYLIEKEQNPTSAMIGNFAGSALSLLPVDLMISALTANPVAGFSGGAAMRGAAATARAAQAAKMANAAQIAKSAAPSFGRRIGVGAIEGAAPAILSGAAGSALQYTPDEDSRLSNSAIGGMLGGLFGGALNAGVDATNLKNLLPFIAEKFKGHIPYERLLQNLESARETETGLGRILENPSLMHLQENILPYVPFSGASSSAQRTGELITEKGEDLLSQAVGGTVTKSSATKDALHDKIIQSANNIRAESRANYSNLDSIAKGNNVSVDRNKFRERASETLSELKKDPDLFRKFSASAKKELEDISKTSDKNFKSSFNDSNILRGLYRDEAQKASMTGDKHLAGIYKSLSKSLDDDMMIAAKNSGNDDVINAWQGAQNFYRENIVPLDNSSVSKFLKDKSPELTDKLVDAMVNLSKNKEGRGKMANLTSLLDQEGMDLLRSDVFSKAISESGEVDPRKIISVMNGLSKDQQALLFKGKEYLIPQFQNLKEISKLNPDALNMMFNPQTGKRALPLSGLSATLGAGSVVGGLIGGPFGSVLGAATSLPTSAIIGGGLNKFLTSESARNKIVDLMMKGQPLAQDLTGQSKYISEALKKVIAPGLARGIATSSDKRVQKYEEEE